MARQYQFPDTLPSLPAGAGKDWFLGGLDVFKKRPVLLILTSLLFLIIFAVLGAIPLIGALAGIVLTPILAFGMLNIVDKVEHDDADLGFGTLFSGFSENPARGIKFGLIYFMLCVASVIIMVAVGFLFGVVFGFAGSPGLSIVSMLSIYMIAFVVQCALMIILWLSLPIVLHNNEIGIMEAMNISLQTLMVNWVPILVYNIIATFFIIIAAMTIVGIFIIFPVLICSTQVAYRQMLTV